MHCPNLLSSRIPRRSVEQRRSKSKFSQAGLRSQAYACPVEQRRQKHLVLILAREFASNLATPTLIADADGILVFYNEAAESVVGVPFAEAGEIPLDEWTAGFSPRTREGELIPPERRPA